MMALVSMGSVGAHANADEAAAPAARVEGPAVVHEGEGVAVRLPAAASYAGSDRFTLHAVADAEVHVFVEADAERRVRRLYWIQFEKYLPGRPELSFNYADGNRRMEMGGIATWVRAVPRRTDWPTRAGSDREHVMAVLTRAGYMVPPEMMDVRLVQLLDDPQGIGRGRRELMVIYSEDLAPTGAAAEDMITGDATNERWEPIEAPLIERAMAAVRIEARR